VYPFRECVHTSRRRRPHPRPCTASSLCHTGDIYQASDKGCIEPVGAGITPILYCIWPYRIHCTAYLLALALIRTHVLFSVGGSCGCEGKSTADTHTGYFTILAAPYWLHHTGYHTVLASTPYCILATPYWLSRRTGYHTILHTGYTVLHTGIRQAGT
jgi:hypothetical protein